MNVEEVIGALCGLPRPAEVTLKIRIANPATGEFELHDCQLVRSAGPSWNNVEVVPIGTAAQRLSRVSAGELIQHLKG